MWKEQTPFSEIGLDVSLKSKAWVEGDVLRIAYQLTGDLDKVFLPKPLSNPRRIIGLWESTCFEMFIKNCSKEEYLEFNITSEYNWNVFHFPSRKTKLEEYSEISTLLISAKKTESCFSLESSISLDRLPVNFWENGKMNIGLTAVIETKEKELSYWALKHADNKPNFHHHDSFVYEL